MVLKFLRVIVSPCKTMKINISLSIVAQVVVYCYWQQIARLIPEKSWHAPFGKFYMEYFHSPIHVIWADFCILTVAS